MNNNNIGQFSHIAEHFHDLPLPEKGATLIGYSAIISAYHLKVPTPDQIAAIGPKHKNYQKERWQVFGPRYYPKKNDLYAHLVFALKYEGVLLDVLSALFERLSSTEIKEIVLTEPKGIYSRRIWFLYEWLMDEALPIKDFTDKKARYVDIVDPKLQYAGPAQMVPRQRVNNNLPGVRNFCPMIRKTKKLESYITKNFKQAAQSQIHDVHSDLLTRTAAFLLLEDSKASFAIEGESPSYTRAERWGRAIGQAAKYPLSHDEFLRLQELVIADFRYIQPGYRSEGGFIGQHDRATHYPIPAHISAKHQDVYDLMEGVIQTNQLLTKSTYPAVLAAAAIAFGFVFIHPFEDGNGRIHRYLLHHVLADMEYTPQGVIFPISYVILKNIQQYKHTLEAYSTERLKYIEWQATENGNVEVLNNTINLYRYYDATQQAEFLFDCIQETIESILPSEIAYFKKYDTLKAFIENTIEMPDRMVSLMINFLQQGGGKLSKRAREKEFYGLTEKECQLIENKYQSIFNDEEK